MEHGIITAHQIDPNAGASAFEYLESIKEEISPEDYDRTKAQLVRVQLLKTQFIAPDVPILIPTKP